MHFVQNINVNMVIVFENYLDLSVSEVSEKWFYQHTSSKFYKGSSEAQNRKLMISDE